MTPARLGHYLLLEQLHLGAFAEVYLGRTRSLPGMEQLVAIKRIHPLVSADEDFREAFLDEARIAAQLRHANIAQVLEVGEEQGTYFIAMEYVSGRPLRALLELATRVGETIPAEQAAWMVSRICEGLEHAHGKSDVDGAPLGIVHRAISPENVLVGFDGEVKLIDFGLAKAASSTQHTQAGTMKGKLGYLSPEQVLGQPVDRRTDLFSAGVLLFEMLTGMRLFGAPNEADTLQMVGDAQVPPLRSLNPAIPEALEIVVLKALAREPDQRYQSASELVTALSPFTTTAEGTFSAAALAKVMRHQLGDALTEETERLRKLAKVRELPLPGPGDAAGSRTPSTATTSSAALLPPAVAPLGTSPRGSDAGLRPVPAAPQTSGSVADAPLAGVAAPLSSSVLAASLFGDDENAADHSEPSMPQVPSTPGTDLASAPPHTASMEVSPPGIQGSAPSLTAPSLTAPSLTAPSLTAPSLTAPSAHASEPGVAGALAPAPAPGRHVTPAFGVGALVPDRPTVEAFADVPSPPSDPQQEASPVAGAMEPDPFALSDGLPRAFDDEDEDEDPEDRTQVLSPAAMEATLDSLNAPPEGAASGPSEDAQSTGKAPARDWRSATQPFAGAASPVPEIAARPAGSARVTATQARLDGTARPGVPAPVSERPTPAEAPQRRTPELAARGTTAQAGAPSARKTTKLPSPAPAHRPASGGHPVLPREPRPSTGGRPALTGSGRAAEPSSAAPADARFPDRSHPAFAAVARASDPTRPSSGSRAALTSNEVVILASNDQAPLGERPAVATEARPSPGARPSPVPPRPGDRESKSTEALPPDRAPGGPRPSPAPRASGVRPPPGSSRPKPVTERPGRTATAASRPEVDREELASADVTHPGLPLPRVTLAVAPAAREDEAWGAGGGRTLARAWPIAAAAAAALLLFLGLWALLRSPDGSPVIVRVTPAEGAIVTLGGRQVQSGRTELIPPGEYELVAMAEGYTRHSQRITVFEDAPEAVYPILLEEETPRVRAPVPSATPVPAAVKEFTATFESEVEGVEIFVEGESIGRTPAARTTLALGRAYRYEARAEGYRSAEGTFGSYGDPAVKVELALEKLEDTRRARPTKPARGVGHLVCTSSPQGAEIFIDGKPTGRRTPVPATDPIELPAGKHRVLFEIAGVVSEVKTITVEKGKTVSLQGIPVDRDREL